MSIYWYNFNFAFCSNHQLDSLILMFFFNIVTYLSFISDTSIFCENMFVFQNCLFSNKLYSSSELEFALIFNCEQLMKFHGLTVEMTIRFSNILHVRFHTTSVINTAFWSLAAIGFCLFLLISGYISFMIWTNKLLLFKIRSCKNPRWFAIAFIYNSSYSWNICYILSPLI